MEQNLIISNGYYTSLTALSVLKQLNAGNQSKVLLAYFKQGSDFNQNMKLYEKIWQFDKVIDYSVYSNRNKFLFDEFNKALNIANFSNIFIPINSSTKKWYYGFKRYNNKTNFIFYEEGLLSYIKPIFDLKLKKIIKNYSCYFNDFNTSFLTLISNNIKYVNNNFNVIDIRYFKRTLLELKNALNINFYDLFLQQTKNIIFIPQYYYSNNKHYNIRKYKDYFEIIEKLLLKGYKVLIKDHPKDSSENFKKYLRFYLKNNSNIVFLDRIRNYPIEVFLDDLNLDFLFSVYSTTLLSASSRLFNLPVFTSYKMLDERIRSFSLYPSISCQLIKESIPDIDNFLAYYYENPNKYYQKFIKPIPNNFYKKNLYNLLIKFLFK